MAEFFLGVLLTLIASAIKKRFDDNSRRREQLESLIRTLGEIQASFNSIYTDPAHTSQRFREACSFIVQAQSIARHYCVEAVPHLTTVAEETARAAREKELAAAGQLLVQPTPPMVLSFRVTNALALADRCVDKALQQNTASIFMHWWRGQRVEK